VVVQPSPRLSEYQELLKEIQDDRYMVKTEYTEKGVPSQSLSLATSHDDTVQELSPADESLTDLRVEMSNSDNHAKQAQKAFDIYYTTIIKPHKAEIRAKLHGASKAIVRICESLAQNQEDKYHPSDFLEKLRLLRCCNDAREQHHKDLFDLQTDSNARYEKLVLSPYSLLDDELKMNEARKFFCDDYIARLITYREEVLKRSEQLLTLSQKPIVSGLSRISSILEDLALSIREIVQQLSCVGLHGFKAEVPQQEPSYYHDLPLRYLYKLLLHAKRLIPRLMERNVNVFQVLTDTKDEVRVLRRMFLQAKGSKENANDIRDTEIDATEQDGHSVEDLKQRVEVVKKQWEEESGRELTACIDRVQAFLLEHGGWDESTVV